MSEVVRRAPRPAGLTSAGLIVRTSVAPAPAADHDVDDLAPPVYDGGCRLVNWGNTARSGMTVDICLGDTGPYAAHPFKGLGCGREGGQRFRLGIFTSLELAERGRDAEPIYRGEAVLMRWSDDSSSGMTVRFLLDAGLDGTGGQHPFEGFVTGRKEGESLVTTAYAIGDDEGAQHPGRIHRKTPFSHMSDVRQSQILSRDALFVSYLADNEKRLLAAPLGVSPAGGGADYARAFLYAYLAIESRSVLSAENVEGERARKLWRELMGGFFREKAGMRG